MVKREVVILNKIAMFVAWFMLIGVNLFAQDILIDSNGNLITGTSNSYGNLKVIGNSGEHAVAGESNGTGAAGVYGKNTDQSNYGILGDDRYGVYGESTTGHAGYFEGDVDVTGDLTVNGTFISNHDHDTDYVNESQVDSVTSSMISNGAIQLIDLSFIPADGHSLDAADGSPLDAVFVDNDGRVGIGTAIPAGMLDVSGDICLGGVCRTSWPTGSGSGAFTDTGSLAYYSGGNVGIGTANPQIYPGVDSRVLHMVHPPAPSGDTAVGLRLEIENTVEGGIVSAYNSGGNGGLFVGTLSSHRLGLGTNDTEQVTLTTNGNLGIGTPDPLQTLHVQGSAYVFNNIGVGVNPSTHNLQVSGSSALLSSGTDDFHLYLSKNLPENHSSLIFQENFIGYAELGLTGDNNFHLKVSADGTLFTDAMVVDSTNGNIAIGIDPAQTSSSLSIMSDNSHTLFVENSSSNSSIMAYSTGSGEAVSIYHTGTGPSLVIRDTIIPGSELLVVDNTGNVGIGTSTPTAALDIAGSTGYDQLRIRSSYTPTGTGDTNGNVGDITWDDNYSYVKTSGGWKRSALSSF